MKDEKIYRKLEILQIDKSILEKILEDTTDKRVTDFAKKELRSTKAKIRRLERKWEQN